MQEKRGALSDRSECEHAGKSLGRRLIYCHCITTGVHRACEAGEGACNYVNSKIHTSGETPKRLLTSIYGIMEILTCKERVACGFRLADSSLLAVADTGDALSRLASRQYLTWRILEPSAMSEFT